jgi:NTE family protein
LENQFEQHRAFVAFAGGGAKGIIHVGALKALEQKGVRFRGVAGTSAGAIVACLKAAGFDADELIDPHSEKTIIDLLRLIDPKIQRATDLFGPAGWIRIRAFRWLVSSSLFSRGLIAALVWASLFLFSLFAASLISLITTAGALVLWVALGALFWFLVRSITGGLATAVRLKRALGILLQQRMFPGQSTRTVLMSDFGGNRPSLKIVSANLSQGKLQLFSPDRTPNVPVADAVAASICLPLIFTPWIIGGELHVDGGIVSNLPAWPFDEERELDPEALTIAIEIADRPRSNPVTLTNWPPAALRTALFGSGELNLRAVGAAERLLLETKLTLLQFDSTPTALRQEVLDATNAASYRLDKRLFRRPALYRSACRVTQELTIDVLESIDMAGGRVRVGVGIQDRDYFHSLRLRYSVGYEVDHDEGMLVPIEGSILGAVWRSNESQFEIAPLPEALQMPGDPNRLRRKALWPNLRWQLCVPIRDPKDKIRLVIQVDGDAELPQEPIVAEAVTRIEEAVKETFGLILQELATLEDDDGMEK